MARRVPRGLYVALSAALCLAAAAGAVALLIADTYDPATTLGYTAGLLIGFGLVAAAGASIIGGLPRSLLGWLCVIVAATGFGLLMVIAWDADESVSDGLLKATGSLIVFSLALGLASVTVGRSSPRDSALIDRLVALTVLATLATATLLTVAIVDDVTDELYFRLTAVVAVLAALGTALVPVLRAMRSAA